MDKEKIYAVIRKHILQNLEDVKESDIDYFKPLKDFGANSLDVIEVVSCSMRELGIQIPRAELADIKTIDDLAGKFLQHYGGNASAA